ncbi:hypothetical protein TNCV_3929891 [Trichonephila clavipes]|nr:hypothetical protein TNCV_3929891 [Trichonephila clavipes]
MATSSLTFMKLPCNEWYCHQKDRPRSQQSIDILTGLLLGIKRNGIGGERLLSLLVTLLLSLKESFQANSLTPSYRELPLQAASVLVNPFACFQQEISDTVELITSVMAMTGMKACSFQLCVEMFQRKWFSSSVHLKVKFAFISPT